MSRPLSSRLLALGLSVGLLCAAPVGAAPPAKKGVKKVERYPPSFRLAVKRAIQDGVRHLNDLQLLDGHWGDPANAQTMGHTALPLLALLKAGVPAEDVHVKRALRALAGMKMQRVYSVALYMMALQALYQPKLDTLDTDVGTRRSKRVKPREVRERLSKAHAARMEAGLAYLLDAQNASGLWHYDVPAAPTETRHDLSNTQYGLLGLRALADAGFSVKASVWRAALRGLFLHQDARGKRVPLVDHRVKDGYAYASRTRAQVRGFHYATHKRDGPAGEKTLWLQPATESMTGAGVACVAICQEGLWRSRRFSGQDRKKSMDAIRNGLAWMQENFSVTENVGHPKKAHHMYTVYGLERMGMLTGRRWLGDHDWYKEGADMLLQRQDGVAGGWGRHVTTAFGILFLKRATRRRDMVVTTD